MSGDAHVRICERLGVQFPRATRLVIRVAADGSGSRIDIRSVSRQGRSDFGVNARRIRAYMEILKARVG